MLRLSALCLLILLFPLLRAAGRGLPGGNSLSFASPKESKQRKGDPAVCVPTLRFGQPAVLDVDGGPQNSLRSNSCGPDPAYVCAPRRSQKGFRTSLRCARPDNSQYQPPQALRACGGLMAERSKEKQVARRGESRPRKNKQPQSLKAYDCDPHQQTPSHPKPPQQQTRQP